MSTEPPLTFGDKVRIRTIPETEATGLAGRVGSIRGETTPSVTGVPVVGALLEDRAIHVFVEDLDQGAWFSADLLEFIDHGAGTTITLDGISKQWVRDADGSWDESPRSLRPREWLRWVRDSVMRFRW